ncbi:hypothetical protein [Spongiibacter marinus]|uniref:hypothetical protein n=1 Tax=Spongiibacter marinus TaxID=354246 RepID=UPI0012B5E8BE|nr:hypothetical protein [Spongiibacter marinus]
MSLEITSLISNISAPAVAGAIIGIVIGIIPILKGDIENAWKKHFCRQVRSGIIKDHLSYEDMLHIAERWRQDRKLNRH